MALDMFHYSFYIFGLFCLLTIKLSEGETFVLKPGDGKDFIYSPVDRNATISCAVSEPVLEWVIDGLSFESTTQAVQLHSRNIFRSTIETLLEVNTSHVRLFGDITKNNNTEVCCQTIVAGEVVKNCTTLVVYNHPSPPEQVSVNHIRNLNFSISWMVSRQVGVEQNFSVTIYSIMYPVTTSVNYYVHEIKELHTVCGAFLAYVQAVNGAGESDPSNNVTIPSLPDIEPVTASLTHQVWKSNGHIMVNVSFGPAGYCIEYPVMSYVLTVTTQESGVEVNRTLVANETGAVLDELERDERYLYSVTATNVLGLTNASGQKMLVTTDVQSVRATVRGSIIQLECRFIFGSDALGCKTVLVSNCSNVTDKDANLTRNQSTATGQIFISYNISCYYQVFAHTIDTNNTVSNLSIPGRVHMAVDNTQEDTHNPTITVTISVSAALLLMCIVLIIAIATFYIVRRREEGMKSYTCSESQNISESPKDKHSLTQAVPSTPTVTAKNLITNGHDQDDSPTHVTEASQESPIKHNNPDNIGQCASVIQTESTPIYALPEKLKQKSGSDQTATSITEKDKIQDDKSHHDEDHVYYVLESEKATEVQDTSPQHCEQDRVFHPPEAYESNTNEDSSPVYQDVMDIVSGQHKDGQAMVNQSYTNKEEESEAVTNPKEYDHASPK